MDNRWPGQAAFPANGAGAGAVPQAQAMPGAAGYGASQPAPAAAAPAYGAPQPQGTAYGAPQRPAAVSAPISPDATAYLPPVQSAPAAGAGYGYPSQTAPGQQAAAGYGAPGAAQGWQQQPATTMAYGGARVGQRSYTVADVAMRWNCAEGYVYEQMQRGMPFRRQPNGLYSITEQDLVGWEYMMAVVASQQEEPKGHGLAIGAIVSTAVFVLLIVLFIVFYEPIAQAIEGAFPNVHVLRFDEIAAMMPWA